MMGFKNSFKLQRFRKIITRFIFKINKNRYNFYENSDILGKAQNFFGVKMDNEEIKQKLLQIENTDLEFTVTMTGL